MKKFGVVFGALMFAGTTSFAGGMSAPVTEPAPVPMETETMEPKGSLPGWVIPVGIVVALLAVVASADD